MSKPMGEQWSWQAVQETIPASMPAIPVLSSSGISMTTFQEKGVSLLWVVLGIMQGKAEKLEVLTLAYPNQAQQP